MLKISLPLKWPYGPAMTGLLGLLVIYALGAWSVAAAFGAGDRVSFLLYSGPVIQVTVMLFLFFLGWRVWSLILFQRPARLTMTLIRDVRDRLFTRPQLAAALPVFTGFIVFMSVFSSMKTIIPLVHPYVWDGFLAGLDRALHGGIDPWRILQPVFGHAWMTAGLNILYNLWFVVMFAVLYWQLFDLRRPALRMRFFWAFFLCFMVNGTILAILLSSAGPCYYHYVVGGPDPFSTQMDYLRGLAGHYPVWAIATQDQLWKTYQANASGLGSGISAMPSVHVSIAFLFALLSWEYGWRARWFFMLFAALIMIGSVHLAWHYAVDGYLGAIVTFAIWGGAGLWLKDKS